MSDFGFGQNFDCLETTKSRFVVDVVQALNIRRGIYAQYPSLAWLPLDILWCPLNRQTLRKAFEWRREMTRSLVEKAKATNSLFSTSFTHQGGSTDCDIPDPELIAEAQFLLVAGMSNIP